MIWCACLVLVICEHFRKDSATPGEATLASVRASTHPLDHYHAIWMLSAQCEAHLVVLQICLHHILNSSTIVTALVLRKVVGPHKWLVFDMDSHVVQQQTQHHNNDASLLVMMPHQERENVRLWVRSSFMEYDFLMWSSQSNSLCVWLCRYSSFGVWIHWETRTYVYIFLICWPHSYVCIRQTHHFSFFHHWTHIDWFDNFILNKNCISCKVLEERYACSMNEMTMLLL
jgi:hypothetical protein